MSYKYFQKADESLSGVRCRYVACRSKRKGERNSNSPDSETTLWSDHPGTEIVLSRHNMRVNSCCEPGHLKKMVKCPALRASCVGKYPAPRSCYDSQMPVLPLHQTNIYAKILVVIFDKHKCFSSILQKTDHE